MSARIILSLIGALALPWQATGHAQETKATPEVIELKYSTLEAQIDGLVTEHDLSGVIYVYLNGEVLLLKPYGESDPATGRMNQVDTIFGIGSRPIDFTIASIYLLAQRDQLALDDTLTDHFTDVPDDRKGMTIRQMLTGKSGLPDFPANPEKDWDADLAWIDRAEFERRTMEVPLLFAPGQGEEDSHWAFGVLAAIVERVSDKTYERFLSEEFFDPAGMTRTGSYGERRNLEATYFAAGDGDQVGLPNIPPNWGPTSWLVKGSGGMYSNLDNLLKFYDYVTASGVLEQQYAAHFLQFTGSVDGSDRGFRLFSFNDEGRNAVAFAFFNKNGPKGIQVLARPIISMLRAD